MPLLLDWGLGRRRVFTCAAGLNVLAYLVFRMTPKSALFLEQGQN
eukprot:SAG22_NODE_12552_length_438_cov_0.914454_1_plen_44_part_10